MSYQQREWKCGDCNQVFRGGTEKGADAQFLNHARDVHHPKVVVVTIDTTEPAS